MTTEPFHSDGRDRAVVFRVGEISVSEPTRGGRRWIRLTFFVLVVLLSLALVVAAAWWSVTGWTNTNPAQVPLWIAPPSTAAG
jgi:hypothetical protein